MNIWIILAGGAAVLTLLYLALRPTLKRARAYSDLVSTCGYLAPPPTERGLRWLMRVSRFMVWAQVGKLDIRGRENLDLDGPVLVAPNHPNSADVAVLPLAVNRPARYMAARGVFRAFWGLGGLAAAPMGAFAVDLDKGKGGPARDAAIKVLTSGQMLVMFPEGWAYLDGVMGPMKKGSVRIVKEAARELGKTTYIVPVFLRYGRYPGSWIRKLSPPIEYLFVLLNGWYFRRGCVVVIGKPIPVQGLPDDDEAATELLRQHIVALDPKQRNGLP